MKIDKWDGAAVKNSLDDAAKKVCIQYNEGKNVHTDKLADFQSLVWF